MSSNKIPSPEDFFGFKMGADRKLARWDKIVEYFWKLDKESDRIIVKELGKSTEGNPFILAIISSPENLKNLDEIKSMSWQIAHPKGIPPEQIEKIFKKGKTVVEITNSMHATEIGGTQMAPELAYELITKDDLPYNKIREETVLLLIPCFNPDGQIMVTDWYNKYLGTKFEGVDLPWLYHKYVGHDNNRDTPLQQMIEMKYWVNLTFREWFPQVYFDHHHMGSYGARFYVPPLAPGWIDPNIDPLVWTEQRLYGGNMASKLESEGKTGVEYETFVDEFMTTTNHMCRRMNICGMLSESASAKLATPIYIHYQQLTPGRKNRPEYNPQTNFPHPWPGGWWRLRDIVEQQKISSIALLEIAAYFRERILRNMYMKAQRAIKLGEEEPPYAFIIPKNQNDMLTVYRLLEAYHSLGVEIHQANSDFIADNICYEKGCFVIFCNQIARPYILATLPKTLYKYKPWNVAEDGTPIATLDPATQTIPEYMGVKVYKVDNKFEGKFQKLEKITRPEGSVEIETEKGWLLDGKVTESFKAINKLLSGGIKVHRITEKITNQNQIFQTGAFYIEKDKNIEEKIKKIAKEYNLVFHAIKSNLSFKSREVKPRKIGLYQRYYGGNIQEGWTRWLLEEFGFEYNTVVDEDIKSGLNNKYDILILPSDATPFITGENLKEYMEEKYRGNRPLPLYPPEYRSGIGEEGVDKIKDFVEKGGTLITLNEATNFAIEKLEVPVLNEVKDLKPKDFLCPGSTLHVKVDINHPIGYGAEKDLLILFLKNSLALKVKPGYNNEDYQIIAQFPDRQILESGWLIGEEYLSRKAAIINAKYGKGNIILFGFEPLFRAQTYETFKFFFNSLLKLD